MIDRPNRDASEAEVVAFAQQWVELAARAGFETALLELDSREGNGITWSQPMFDELTFDHFDDGRHPKITDPVEVRGLRVKAYRYDDGSGFAVDHDLPLDGKRSDFTAQFDFTKREGTYHVTLRDIHVL